MGGGCRRKETRKGNGKRETEKKELRGREGKGERGGEERGREGKHSVTGAMFVSSGLTLPYV